MNIAEYGKKIFASDSRYRPYLILLFVIFVALLTRYITLEMIETGGDAVRKWRQLKYLYFGFGAEDWSWNHHTARLGINVPTYLSIIIFGTAPWVYYVPTISCFMLLVIFVYLTGKEIHSELLGCLAAMAVIFDPGMIRSGCQLLPAVYSATYIAGSFYFMLKASKSEGRNFKLFLCLSAGFAFLGYLSKIQTLFFVPGLVFSIWVLFPTKRKQSLSMFVGVMALLYLVETLSYAIFTEYRLGRIGIILDSYGHSGRLESLKINTLTDLFKRYTKQGVVFRTIFYTFLSSLALMAFFRKKMPIAGLCLGAMCFGFFFFITFSVKSIDPLVPLTYFNVRYLVEAFPSMFLIILISIFSLSSALLKSQRLDFLRPKLSFFTKERVIFGAWACVVVGACATMIYLSSKYSGPHTLTLLAQYEEMSLMAHEKDLIVVAKGPKSSHAYKSVFIDPDLNRINGFPPKFASCKESKEKCYYFMRAGKTLDKIPDDTKVIWVDRRPMGLFEINFGDLYSHKNGSE